MIKIVVCIFSSFWDIFEDVVDLLMDFWFFIVCGDGDDVMVVGFDFN